MPEMTVSAEKEPSLAPILKELEENKKLPAEEKDYSHLYLSLEDYIVKSKSGYTKESLRAAIKKEFNTQLFPPMLRIIFNAEKPELFIFSEMLLKEAAGEMGDFNDFRAVLKDLDVGIEDSKPNFDAFELNFLRSKDKEKVIGQIHKALFSLSGIAAPILGEDKTKILLGEIFNKTAGKYRNFAVFNEAMRELPPGIFVEERREILNPQAAAAAKAVQIALQLIKGGGIKVDESLTKQRQIVKRIKEINPEEIRKAYLDIIGPLGDRQFERLENLKKETIIRQIEGFRQEGLLDDDSVKRFKDKIGALFR
jgi:hypothetical protein